MSFEPSKREMLPLYEFKLRIATIKRENLFAQSRKLIERIQKWNDEINFEKLASEEAKEK